MTTLFDQIPLTKDPAASALKITVEATPLTDVAADLLLLPCCQNESTDKSAKMEHDYGDLDKVFGGALQEGIELHEYKGAAASTMTTRVAGKVRSVALFGFGKMSALDAAAGCKIGACIGKTIKGEKAKAATLALPPSCPVRILQSVLESLLLTLSDDAHKNRLKTGDRIAPLPLLEALTIIPPSGLTAGDIDKCITESRAMAAGVLFAKDLVSMPPNYCHPASLADAAIKMAQEGGLEGKILSVDECRALGMGSYLAVGKGAEIAPRFIHLCWKGESPKKKVALVGKGVCHDTGGYNLKVGSMIEMMKFDMGGGAAVLGVAKAIGALKPKNVEVHFIVPAVLNLISHNAYLPGDVLTASNGKTIEVGNTDAEGRLILNDSLVYAEKTVQATTIIDIATLTGACIVALGTKCAGLFTPDDTLSEALLEAAKVSGESLWRLPLLPDAAEELKGTISDLKNVGGRWGGAITAATFLKEFVDKASWAHIDAAGPAWDWKENVGTGYAVRLLTELVTK
ncbi:unnamed protein product [Vitrella brassicaformis CCMP3155]|uniref:Cytosol aminopeptidase domain-containing protein n=2 Tax=Vitrella brassicaformis TaxID=1169539 RepID=A0A0G4GNP0_VITBC|nr:unnamed protein product [Vitrella brassicaformis CCMP3155]|eukprot:CEM31894.1 unnamed protein product [Vitrella brassicaformis CCMP3155]